MNVEWKTMRLIIKRTVEEDFEELGPLLLDYNITKYLLKNPVQIRNIESAKSFFYDYLFNGIISFTIRIKSTNEVIGQIGYPYESDNLSIFYWIGSKFQDQGFASEATIGLTNYIFRKSLKKKFQIQFHKENEKSSKLAVKIISFILQQNPDWVSLTKEDQIENYQIINIDHLFVRMKLQSNDQEDRIDCADKSTFPDEFLIVGQKIQIHLNFFVISKEKQS
ncbi:hypothetical protein M9Y10_016015 [Tritrichomonas musculus]|uniref:N-acetyltransferase domain-containing protein n=1 Tax=Tritrichomonas musculus TaxID=1915356 RepID=A0ABR2I5E9_9EUKA